MGVRGGQHPREAHERSLTPMARYSASERKWVARVLARLTPEDRERYELECRRAPRHPKSGRLYDLDKVKIAEMILLERSKRGSV